MEKQLIISIGREYGSGGHEIAEKLAEEFGLELYDKNLLKQVADEKSVNPSHLEKYDEVPRNLIFSRNVRGYSNSIEENVANLQFEFIKKQAQEGKSFVVVGRCAESILKDHTALISIFILGDENNKIERIKKIYHLSTEEAKISIYRHDRKRKNYHNYYCKGKWGDSRNYDICVNSTKLGEEMTAKMLAKYIRKRMELW